MKYTIQYSVNQQISECSLNLEKKSSSVYVITSRICDINYCVKGETIWDAFNKLRIILENKKIFIICNAIRLNCYPYNIQRNFEYRFLSIDSFIERNEKLFFNIIGKWCNQKQDIVNFFEVLTEEYSSVL